MSAKVFLENDFQKSVKQNEACRNPTAILRLQNTYRDNHTLSPETEDKRTAPDLWPWWGVGELLANALKNRSNSYQYLQLSRAGGEGTAFVYKYPRLLGHIKIISFSGRENRNAL